MNNGDYVIATKYSDGDPKDQWCIGFFYKEENCRYYVIDDHGQQFRNNGFRRIRKISKARGAYILNNTNIIENSDHSIWWWLRQKMK